MPWVNDTFFYTKGLLKRISLYYANIYDGLPSNNEEITNPWALAEYKADFDNALKSIGRGKWDGCISNNFKTYKYFGRLQRIIIADMLSISDRELTGLGFYDIPRLRGYSYYLMAKYLNG